MRNCIWRPWSKKPRRFVNTSRGVFTMTQQGESLRERYRQLTEMCHKPDVELLQVRKEGPSSERDTLLDKLL